MLIHVRIIGTLKSLEEGAKPFSLEVPEGSSVSRIIDLLNLKEWEVGFVLLNGERQTKEAILKEKDQLVLVAPLAGG